jgi:Secretion system C-terminal sorting domain
MLMCNRSRGKCSFSILLFSLFMNFTPSFGQSNGNIHLRPPINEAIECDFPQKTKDEIMQLPWYGNNKYLESLLDSIGYPSNAQRIVGLDRVWFRVPIKFWVYRFSNGTGGPSISDLQIYIDNLNRMYNELNDTKIGFYMKCEIGYVDDDDHMAINNYLESANLAQLHKEKGCINVHIVDALIDDNLLGFSLRARFLGIDGIFLNATTYNSFNNEFATTLSHEIGHYFELDHTHETPLSINGPLIEAIDRNRKIVPFSSVRQCEVTGDLLNDTPADPDLSLNNGCFYTSTTQFDPYGDNYFAPPLGSMQPQTRNLLSYNGTRSCRDKFSRLQIAVMLYSICRGKSEGNRELWKAIRSIYDEYEPDNNFITSRIIDAGETQERNFHQQLNKDYLGNPYWTVCDVDWIRFTPTCNSSFDIETFYNAGTTPNDTRLTLYAADGTTVLAQNDNISATNLFSKITYSFTAGLRYLIKVEPMNPIINDYNNSYYNISIGGTKILGLNEFCGTSTYSLDAPVGTTVTWIVAQNNVANSSVSGNILSLTQKPITNPRIANSGNVTFTANYSHPCIGTGSVTRTVFIGTKTPFYSLNAADNCPGSRYEAIGASNNGPGVTYDWYINGVLDPYHGYKIRRTFSSPTGTYIGLQVWKPGCGVSEEYYKFWSCNGRLQFSISPNPASGIVTIASLDEQTFEKIRVIDKMGNLKKEWSFTTPVKTGQLNLSGFSTDVYTVQVFDGNAWSSKLMNVN